MVACNSEGRLVPKLISFDVFGTLIDMRGSAEPILRSVLGAHAAIDIAALWEHWEARNIARYWEPYRSYREICAASLAESFAHFKLPLPPTLIERYFAAFSQMLCFAEVAGTLERLARRNPLALVSNIDDDLLAATPLGRTVDLVCTAERARGYKPNGTLFRYLIAHAPCAREDILHCGQSQFTDLVGGKPLGLNIVWVNRRGLARDASVPRPDYEIADLGQLLGRVAL